MSTKPTASNAAYADLVDRLATVIPMEIAIRVAKTVDMEEFQRLHALNEQIKTFWISCGFSEEAIKSEGYVDACWDIFQLGYDANLRINKDYTKSTIEEFKRTSIETQRRFQGKIKSIRLVFADRYRVCDLLNGNNIGAVIKEVDGKIKLIRNIKEGENIQLGSFVHSLRRPVKIRRGAIQQVRFPKDGVNSSHLGLLLDSNMTQEDVEGALHDFLYHYAMFRLEGKPIEHRDRVHLELIKKWAEPVANKPSSRSFQYNALLTKLNGLYCWNRRREFGAERRGSMKYAIEETQKLYSSPPDAKAIANHYHKIESEIRELISKLKRM
ncbi:hypothetical protein [Pseudomonas piscis]|uniref:hypothetical protein n=1 Tax=Pseudomonas piscis TaxID=2614538 RepID=UPI0021D579DC|nr:hypothetical protein [Pseudomonas piscis]MCU7648587.1 hypothetical protein [Pseudomonas piscis]